MEKNTFYGNTSTVDKYTMRDMRQRFGLDENDTSRDEKILALPSRRFLDEYLSWHGIIGYTGQILDAIYMAYGVSLDCLDDMEVKRELDE